MIDEINLRLEDFNTLYIDNLYNNGTKYDANKYDYFYCLFLNNRKLIGFLNEVSDILKTIYYFDTVVTKSIVFELKYGLCIQFPYKPNYNVDLSEISKYKAIKNIKCELFDYIKLIYNVKQISLNETSTFIETEFNGFDTQQINEFLDCFKYLYNNYDLETNSKTFTITINEIKYRYDFKDITPDCLISELQVFIKALQNEKDIYLDSYNKDKDYIEVVVNKICKDNKFKTELFNELDCAEFDLLVDRLCFSVELEGNKGSIYANTMIKDIDIQRIISNIKQIKRVLRMFEMTVRLL